MHAWPGLPWALSSVITFALSFAATGLGIVYAKRRRLLDLPGRRRSHAQPTPRGGGIGIVLGAMFSLLAFAGWSATLGPGVLSGLLAALVLVGAAGWIDDHRGLGALPRIFAHGLAGALLLGVPLAAGLADMSGAQVLLFGLVCLGVLVAIVWSINLHNFMDGIDGLLALQALFVFAVLAALFACAGRTIEAQCMALLGAAVAGFVPFNFPRARIFMGDVGSGALGLLVAVGVLWQMTTPAIAAASGFVLCSAFVTDATCTLLSRMLRGRRWYSAHREHLYQWLVRCGCSHAHVVALYMGWNVLIVLPAVCWMNRSPAAPAAGATARATGIGTAAAVYALAVAAWWLGKSSCARILMRRRRHVIA